MRLLVVSLMMLIWGSQCFASRSTESDVRSVQLQTIQSWLAHLNNHVPGLNLEVSCDLKRTQVLSDVLNDLQALQDSLERSIPLAPESLLQLACTRPECGGGGGGGTCKTCVAPDGRLPGQDSL